MSDEIRVNRAPQPSTMRQEPVAAAPAAPMADDSSGGSKAPWVILGIIVVVLIVLGVLFRGKLFAGHAGTAASMSDVSGYQAVFLTNGQVYFGKMADADGDYADLKDIFYLQVVQPPLQGQQTTPQATSTGAQPQISLVKLGNELHGPVDEMHISRSQILFYEDLKTDGQVVKAIEAYKASNPASGAPATTPVGK